MTTVLQVGTGIAFLLLGMSKWISKEAAGKYTSFGLPKWFRYVMGILEMAGAILLFVGSSNLLLGAVAAFYLAILTASMIIMQIKRGKGSMSGVLPSVTLMMICFVIVSMNLVSIL
ncbi:DoxX family protein [Paenibacillus polygoni]|uniref:DoxX family protein n=1 Tax=Paenibacillus polygoni TaxID=3050112 RepID=A0ABY8WX88_9BACL|nr:DoxX family protein [Paenibacillus polygoni]WIV17657.1 DoxX family protein [Paenibacillus polygoni]